MHTSDFGGYNVEEISRAIAGNIWAMGRSVVLRGPGGETGTRAIIDPVQSVSAAARSISSLPDGYFPPGSYQYFGLPEGDLTEVTTVKAGETVYLIRRKEPYRVGDQMLYWWALMLRGGSNEET